MVKKRKDTTPPSAVHQSILDFMEFADLKYGDKLRAKAHRKGIYTLEEWERGLDERVQWLIENRVTVLLNLAPFRSDWPACCETLCNLLSLAEFDTPNSRNSSFAELVDEELGSEGHLPSTSKVIPLFLEC